MAVLSPFEFWYLSALLAGKITADTLAEVAGLIAVLQPDGATGNPYPFAAHIFAH
jgi:hypothetical protein